MKLAGKKTRADRARGFSLVEVAMALAVASFCLITILGMLGSGLTQTRKSEDIVAAANTADAIAGNWRANPAGLLAPGKVWIITATPPSGQQPTPTYVDANGNAVGGAASAAYAETYSIVPENVGANAKGYTDVNGDNIPDLYYVTLTLEWPPLAVQKGSGQINTYRVLVALRPS